MPTTPRHVASQLAFSQTRVRMGVALGVVILIMLTWMVYAPTLRAGYIWNDDTFLWNNPYVVANDSPVYFWKLWGADRPPDYFPLTSSMLWVEWHWLWGDNPAGYHAMNVVLHTCSALMLWVVLRRLGVTMLWAWTGAMLFALHPVNVESVAWITERKNTLSLPPLLGAFWCWLNSEESREGNETSPRWYAASLVLFTLSLLAKTAGVMLPVVMLLMIWRRRGHVGWQDVRCVVPYFVISAVLGAMTVWYQTQYAIGVEVVRTDGFFSRLLLAGRAVWFYLWKVLWPVELSFVYPRWSAAEATRVWNWLPLVMLVLLVCVLWWLRFRRWAGATLTALGIYVAMLLPVLGFIDIYFMRYSLVADHWQYFAITAPVSLAACGGEWLWCHSKVCRIPLALCVAVALSGYGVMTWCEASEYHDSETLWRATIRANPQAWVAYVNLGSDMVAAGRLVEAEHLYRHAVGVAPDNELVHAHLGDLMSAKGDHVNALASFRRALELSPDNPAILVNYGSALAESGRTDEAIAVFLRVLELYPSAAAAHYNLAAAYEKKGDLAGAAREYRYALRHALRKNENLAPIHYNLGQVLMRLKLVDQAIEQFEEAVRLQPNDKDARQSLEIARRLRSGM